MGPIVGSWNETKRESTIWRTYVTLRIWKSESFIIYPLRSSSQLMAESSGVDVDAMFRTSDEVVKAETKSFIYL